MDVNALALMQTALSGPLGLHSGTAQQMRNILEAARTDGDATKLAQQIFGGPQPQAMVAGGGVAVLPLHGFIMQRGPAWYDYYGIRTLESFIAAFDQAISDEDISTVVVHVASPGGSVSGVPEAAARILAARGKKRLIAVCDPLMASAAYWVASACDEVVVTPSGMLGSIGVISFHFDWSAFYTELGVQPTLITYGEHKGEANEFQPLERDAEAHLLEIVSDYGALFDGAVAAHRDMEASAVQEQLGGGRAFTAARGVAMGLGDRVGTLDEVLEELGVRRRGSTPHAASGPLEIAAGSVIPPHLPLTEPLGVVLEHEPSAVPFAAGFSLEPIPTPTAPVAATPVIETDASDGDVAPAATEPPTPTGPMAQEADMEAGTATEPQADGGAKTTEAQEAALLAAERSRVQLINATCDMHPNLVTTEQRAEWIQGGASAESVQRAIVAAAKTEAAPLVDPPRAAEERSAPAIIKRRTSSREEEPGFAFGMALLGLCASTARRMGRVDGDPVSASDWLADAGYPEIGAAMRSDRQADGGAWVPENYMAGEFIELLRPESAVRSLNPRFIPLTGGNASMPKLTGGATAYYQGEAQPATKSQGTTGRVNLVSKKLSVFVPVSFDLLRRASPDAGMTVRDDGLAAVAERGDLAMIRGDGGAHTPQGMKTLAAAANKFDANATVNLNNVTNDLGTARLKLAEANVKFRRPGWVFAPRTEHYLMTVRDGNGNYVFRDEMLKGTLWGYPYRTTTQIPVNLGGGSDESEVYLADFAELLLGEEENIRVDVFDQVTYWDGAQWVSSAQNDEVVIRIIAEHDFNTRHAEAIAVIEAVTWGA